MLTNTKLKDYLSILLAIDTFSDYCPNGMQVEGKKYINNIISGVSVNTKLIKSAISSNADAIIVHHGLFWHKDTKVITGNIRDKLALLLKHDINLYGYHLPLDAHRKFGNNIALANLLEIKNPTPVANSLLWQGELNMTTDDFITKVAKKLNRKPLVVGAKKQKIAKIAWCSGGAQNYLSDAISLGVDAYLSGEISEQTTYNAEENNIVYISAGHHATERYGVQLLSNHISSHFSINHKFVEIANVV